jgi:hypothetical protein
VILSARRSMPIDHRKTRTHFPNKLEMECLRSVPEAIQLRGYALCPLLHRGELAEEETVNETGNIIVSLEWSLIPKKR